MILSWHTEWMYADVRAAMDKKESGRTAITQSCQIFRLCYDFINMPASARGCGCAALDSICLQTSSLVSHCSMLQALRSRECYYPAILHDLPRGNSWDSRLAFPKGMGRALCLCMRMWCPCQAPGQTCGNWRDRTSNRDASGRDGLAKGRRTLSLL